MTLHAIPRRIAILMGLGLALFAGEPPPGHDLFPSVDVRMEGGFGPFRGASLPYGMMKFGPPHGNEFTGFTTSALSGGHIGDLGLDLIFRPHAGPLLPAGPDGRQQVPLDFARSNKPDPGSTPAWCRATGQCGTVVEGSATLRAAIARISFPVGKEARLFLPPQAKGFPAVIAGRQVLGKANWLHYAIEVDQEPLACERMQISDQSRMRINQKLPERLCWSFTPGSTIIVRLATSMVSGEGALANLRAEIPGWDPGVVRAAAEATWRQHLNRFVIDGGSEAERRAFATFLYRASLHMNIASDVDGGYVGIGKDKTPIRNAARPRYVSFSGWDVYRTWAPLTSLIEPERMGHMVASLIDHGRENGELPLWSSAYEDHRIMEGRPSVLTIGTAHALGVRGFDLKTALYDYCIIPPLEMQRINNDWRRQVDKYLVWSWNQKTPPDVSWSLEMELSDFVTARLAQALGDQATATTYLARAQTWQRMLNPTTGYFEPDYALAPLAPPNGGVFCEGSKHTYATFVPYNLGGLFAAMGGPDKVIPRLDRFFTKIDGGEGPGEFCGLNNQSSFHTPWVYCWLGQPWKTQDIVLRAVREIHVPAKMKDDDLGATASWAIFGMAGLYPVIPGVGGFVLHTPTFPRLRMPFGKDRTLEIIARRSAPDDRYIQSVILNGRPHTSSWLPIEALDRPANVLEFTLGPKPSTWATRPEHFPPSFPVQQVEH